MHTTRLKPLWLHLATIAQRLRGATTLALACDFDGTLAPIVAQPGQASVSQRTRVALARLTRLDHVRVAFLSGRTLDDLIPRVGLEGVFYAGAAGLEIQRESGKREGHLPPDATLPDELRASLQEWADRFPGAWLEDKRFSLALHYRNVAPDKQGALDAGVRRRYRRFADRAHLVHGKKVFEFMPSVSRDKAWALQQWMNPSPQDALFFYLGDDTNDEPALALVRKLGGISVAVGRTTSVAEYALDSPEGVTWFLEWLATEWVHARGIVPSAVATGGTVGEEGLL